jgi:hypothetical protein
MWAAEPGRWRNDPQDEVVLFNTTKTTVTVVRPWPDGSTSSAEFTLPQLKLQSWN